MVRNSFFRNAHGDSRIVDVFIYVLYALFTMICVFPFYYIFINTISDNMLVTKGQILLIPRGVHLQNYVKVFQMKGLPRATLVSLGRTILGTFSTLLCTSFLGYAMSRSEYWLHKLWYRYIVITMYFNAGMIPWFINMKNLGMINNFWAYVIPGVVSPFFMILYKTYVESIPQALEESAEIDGAGYLLRYCRIILPLSMSMLATIAIFTAVGQWNAFTDTVFLVTSSDLYTLQYMLFQYLNEAEAIAATMRNSPSAVVNMNLSNMLTSTTIRMTVTVVVVLPVMCVYPFFQRYFVKGIMIGAVKG